MSNAKAYDEQGGLILCSFCSNPSGFSIVGMEASVHYCSDHYPMPKEEVNLVYMPPAEGYDIPVIAKNQWVVNLKEKQVSHKCCGDNNCNNPTCVPRKDCNGNCSTTKVEYTDTEVVIRIPNWLFGLEKHNYMEQVSLAVSALYDSINAENKHE